MKEAKEVSKDFFSRQEQLGSLNKHTDTDIFPEYVAVRHRWEECLWEAREAARSQVS